MEYTFNGVKTETNEICPSFIRIHFVEKEGRQISIIGTRLLAETPCEKQLRPLRRYLEALQSKNPNLKIISIGDYNLTKATSIKKWVITLL